MPEPMALLRALGRRWLLAGCLGVLVAVSVVVLICLFLPPANAEVEARLHVKAIPPSLLREVGGRPDFPTFLSTQRALIRSRLVLNAALRKPEVASLDLLRRQADPVAWLEDQLVVGTGGSPEIMTVAIKGDNPEQAKVLVDAVVSVYLDEIVNKERIRRTEQAHQLREFQQRYEDKLKGFQRNMRALQKQLEGGENQQIFLKQQAVHTELTLATNDLAQTRRELHTLELQAKVDGPQQGPLIVSEAEREAAITKDELMRAYAARKEERQRMLEADRARAVAGTNPPNLQQLSAEIARIEQDMRTRRQNLIPLIEEHIQEQRRIDEKSRQVKAKERIAWLKELEQVLVKDVERLQKEAETLVLNKLDLDDFKRDMEHAQALADRFRARADALEIEREAPNRITPLGEEAVVRIPDEQSRKMRMAGLGGLGAFALVVVSVVFLKFRTRRFCSPAEMGDRSVSV
jgi:succinoglycan biosynthesis transport protein ExoP